MFRSAFKKARRKIGQASGGDLIAPIQPEKGSCLRAARP